MTWLGEMVTNYGLAEKDTLEVGSLNVNGSPRSLFSGKYYGVDMRPGPDVDVVVNAHDLWRVFPDQHFDVVVSAEMLEHDDAPWKSISEMRRVVREGGFLLLTCRGYDERGCFPLHSYPD